MKAGYGWVMLCLALAACSGAVKNGPTQFLSMGSTRAQYTFDDGAGAWDVFSTPGQEAAFVAAQGTLNGAVIPNRGYVWSLSHTRLSDVAIEATVQQTQGIEGNGFGVMCRADAQGNGYYFVISSQGGYAILKGNAATGKQTRLVDWQRSDAIKTGMETNKLQAVCVNDYLSFSINGTFVAEARDKEFSSGDIGAVVAAVDKPVWVSFDNITVRDVAIAG